MIVNAFFLCASAEKHDDATLSVTHGGVQTVEVPNVPTGVPIELRPTAVLMAQREPGDPDHPSITVSVWSQDGLSGGTTPVMFSGWESRYTDFIHESFPLNLSFTSDGVYLITVHTDDGHDLDTALARWPLGVTAT